MLEEMSDDSKESLADSAEEYLLELVRNSAKYAFMCSLGTIRSFIR